MTDAEKLEKIKEIVGQGGDAYWKLHLIYQVLNDRVK